MKKLIEALATKREQLNRILHETEGAKLSAPAWAEVRGAMYLVDVLLSALSRCKPEDGQATLLRAFGAPGEWGYGTPIGDALLEALKTAEPNPNRWRDATAELPDADIQVLAFDGERHHLAYIGEDGYSGEECAWMDAASGEPCMFTPIAWRHLDNPPER